MGIKVLIVDDNRVNLRLLQEILEDEGFVTQCINESTKVIEAAIIFKPDIILLDIMMPVLDGFEVCKLIKQNSELYNIPVIMITAKTESTDLKRALELGAFDYIKKPVDEIEVVARIYSAYNYKTINDKLREMAIRDGLTGLYNHTFLLELFQVELDKAKRINSNIAFLMIDIDYFKSINDTYGHMMGDVVIREISALLTDTVRTGDIIGRYGGEEFSIVLTEVTNEQALDICDRIRKNVEQHVFEVNGNSIKVTVSIGVCLKKSQSTASKNDIIKIADIALYEAKKSGRNKCEMTII
ncbi:GGDEF domain-containing response regulator [Clostridium omnivorum]|uniref:Stage 0 sporulation protein A homolog n=1 Tax=Clostridium omnivorum TaxID=1604902 RepID=A0ABQ5N8K9_9CLOT|nr:diguanylate cyclase [Clostridium sp. E14]GLC31492.1 diguanylate cyclase response regulator [Clostridium sp. E14]